VLGETYGVMVYQEQVMQAAQLLAGYSLGSADMLRRAMGKKKPEEMAQQREVFRAGAAAKGIPAAKADEVFDLMEKFAGYGFNKSHAAAYSLLAYHTAWLKVHCTAEFYAANMTVEMDDTDKLKILLGDAKQFGVSFEPPDVNRGVYRFEPVDDQCVRYGLGAIKGTGQAAIEAIVAAREGSAGEGGAPFRSLFDFCARVDRQRINKRVVEALIKAGAFDKLHPDRAAMLASVGLALDWADTQAAHADQGGLFDFGHDGEVSHAASTHEPALVFAAPWDIKERLTQEKAAIGFFLSGHLFEQSEAEVRQFCRTRIADLADSREPQLLAGITSEMRIVNGQRGRVMIFQLDDRSEVIEAVANETLFEAHRELLREDELLIVQGRAKLDRFSGGLRLEVTQVWDLAGARARFGRYLAVAVNGIAPPLNDLLRQWPARKLHTEQGDLEQGLGVRLQLRRSDAVADLDLGDQARFWPCDEALARWRSVAHGGQASIVYG
jgi:DNA polymerase-3 subunit alpha